LKNHINKLKPKSEFSRNLLTLMTGTTIAQGIPIAISPILTRFYTPEDFSLFALYISLTTIISVIATGRYELAIMLPKKDSDAEHIVHISILVAIGISLATFGVISIFGKTLSLKLGNIGIETWLYFIPVSIMLTAINQSLNYWVNRKKSYTILARNRVTQTSATAITQLTYRTIATGTGGLIIGQTVGQLVSCIGLFHQFKNPHFLTKKYTLKKLALLKRYKKFPLMNSWIGILNTGSTQAPILMLGILFNPLIVGYFALATRILQIPMTLIGSAIGQVYYQEAAEQLHDDKKLKDLTQNLHKKLLLAGIIPTFCILIGGDWIFAIVFGETWREAGVYAQSLSVWLFFVFASSPLSNILTLQEKHKESLFFNIILILSRIGTIMSCGILCIGGPQTILYYGYIGALLWGGFIFYLMRIIGVSYYETFKQLFPYLFILTLGIIFRQILGGIL